MKKKIVVLLLSLLLITGCTSQEKKEKVLTNLEFDDAYYQVYEPYKKGVGNNYVVNNALNNYDLSEVENSLMNISTDYFPISNSFYQEGQFLSEKELTDLLSRKKLNNIAVMKVGNKVIEPYYISYIHEQDYLASNGQVKGVSVALVLNPYQKYTNDYGTYKYQEVNRNTLIEYGKEQAKEVVSYLYQKEKLKGKRIVVGLYIQNNPDEVLPGSFKFVGSTTNEELSFEEVSYQYQYLDSDYAISHDVDAYNTFSNLKKKITNEFSNIYTSAKGLYVSDRLNNLEITINTSYLNKSELMVLDQIISREISNFNSSILVKVYIKENNELTSLVIKKKNSSKSSAFIMK